MLAEVQRKGLNPLRQGDGVTQQFPPVGEQRSREELINMRLKKLGAALVVVAALGAVLASSAFAAATTTDVKWYTGAAPGSELVGSVGASASQTSPKAVFETEVSEKKVKLEGTGIECVECTIENSGGVAVGAGKLRFTGVTVAEPVGCTVASTLTTKSLSVTADWMIGTVDYIKFVPTAGEENGFITVELGGGASCPISTAIIPKGSVFVQAANTTGTQAASQSVSSSAEINSTAGGTLHVGAKTATLTGTAAFSIAGGAAFGTH